MISQSGFILNIITLCIDIFTCLISLIILICIIHYFRYNRIKQEDRVTVMHGINIYVLLLAYTALLVSSNIQTLLGDLYEYNFNSSLCMFLGYFSPALLTMLYWGFVNQAFFRLCRIVYSTYRWLQSSLLYIIIPPIELILICALFYPILAWQDVVYLPNEYYCYVPYTHTRGILWLAFNCYGNPLILLSLIYLRIAVFLRRQSNNQTIVVKQRQQRDLIIIQRIVITIALLMALGIPGIVFLIMLNVTGEEYPLLLRVEWLFVSFSMIGLSVSVVVFIPQLKSIVLKRFRPTRTVPVGGNVSVPIPIRHIPSTL